MKRLMCAVPGWGVCVCVLLSFMAPAWAGGNEVINAIPDAGQAAFNTRNQALARQELPTHLGRYVNTHWVRSGGLHATAATCTSVALSLDAYTSAGNHITADGAGGAVTINYAASNIGGNCANPGSDVCWVVGSAAGQDFTSAGTRTVVSMPTLPASAFNRVGSTNLYVDCSSVSEPTLPSDSVWLMKTTITNGAIAVVENWSNPDPIRARLNQELKAVNVQQYATGGSGTSGSPWTGWAARIDWTASNQDIFFPAGHYTVTSPITISGLRVHIHGAGKVATTIHYAPTAGSTSGVFAFDAGAAELFQCSLRDLAILSSDTTYQKVGVLISDTSEFHMSNVQVGTDQAWTGGVYPNDSRGMVIQGRELGIIEQVTLAGDLPLQIKDNPNSTIDIDHFVFRDLYLIAKSDTTRPCININPGVNLSNVVFDGTQPWVRGTYGLLWDDNTAAQASFNLKIENVRWEQSTNATGYLLYLSHNSSLQNVVLDNLYGPSNAVVNGIYLRNTRSVSLRNFYHASAGGTALNVTSSTYPILIENMFYQTGSALSVGTLSQVYDAGRFASTQIVRRIYDASAHLPTVLTPGATSIQSGGIVARSSTSQATTGTGEETLGTLTLPGGTLSANGQVARVTAVFSTANNTNSKTARIRWNGTGGDPMAQVTTTSAQASIVLVGYVMRTTSSSVQLIWGPGLANATAVAVQEGAEVVNTDADISVVLRGTTPTASGDLTFLAAFIEYLP